MGLNHLIEMLTTPLPFSFIWVIFISTVLTFIGCTIGYRLGKIAGKDKAQSIGVNWAAIGPVTPSEARKFARRILRAADRVVKRRKKAREDGYKLVKLPGN